MGDITNIFVTRTSYGRVWCWLGQPLKTFVEKVSSARRTLRRVGFAFKVPDIQNKKTASLFLTEDRKEQNAMN